MAFSQHRGRGLFPLRGWRLRLGLPFQRSRSGSPCQRGSGLAPQPGLWGEWKALPLLCLRQLWDAADPGPRTGPGGGGGERRPVFHQSARLLCLRGGLAVCGGPGGSGRVSAGWRRGAVPAGQGPALHCPRRSGLCLGGGPAVPAVRRRGGSPFRGGTPPLFRGRRLSFGGGNHFPSNRNRSRTGYGGGPGPALLGRQRFAGLWREPGNRLWLGWSPGWLL